MSLDLSTHTGWAYYGDNKLVSVGSFDVKVIDYISELRSYRDVPITYPQNLINAARSMSKMCLELWISLGEPLIVTEHTEGSKHRVSQRLLEFIHFAHFDSSMGTKTRYLLNSDWRKYCRCYISQWPDIQKWNKEIGKIKRKAVPTRSGAKIAKIDGKIVTRYDAKRLSIHIANLNHKDLIDQIGKNDNIADAINMGDAALEIL